MCELKVYFQNDQTMFLPGQVLNGEVSLEITKKKIYRFRGLKVAARGYAICKFKEGGESFFAKETEYVGRQQYVSESVNIFKCSDDAPMLFKPDKYTFKF
ncbi:unnamed protein product [Chironomus riparius]|uniref:Arrestin-like N-terminal domain-containing protein n=1 Tax=Chironomus riparius TaxID=315576 RepID=A0A9N9RVP8_9DIPT|nr:unnamed protein product [Chironomus riparius]